MSYSKGFIVVALTVLVNFCRWCEVGVRVAVHLSQHHLLERLLPPPLDRPGTPV